MKQLAILFSVFIMCAGFSCDQDLTSGNCEGLESFLLSLDTDLAAVEINARLSEMNPSPDDQDLIGHNDNLNKFANGLRNDCGFAVHIECYGCIETFPVQSHVQVWLDSAGTQVDRFLDILTPVDTVMTLRSIHY